MKVLMIISLLLILTTTVSFSQVNDWNHGNDPDIYFSGGFVGINKTDPQYRLDVWGNIRGKNYFRLTGVGTGGQGIIADDAAGSTIFSLTRNSGNEIRLQGYGDLTFYTNGNNGNQKMRILKTSGDVIIGGGTDSGGHRLAVKGSINAEEVKVTATVPGPDYVFDPDYDLMPLADLGKYLSKNKHLPEVPSAQEMETNGIMLGEMNMLLLKKIEELTLHTIRQEKLMEELSQELKSIKNEN